MSTAKIALLCGASDMTPAVYQALKRVSSQITVIQEDGIPLTKRLQRRTKRYGVRRVTGQLLFMLGIVPLLRRQAAQRLADVRHAFGFTATQDVLADAPHYARVPSVNAAETQQILTALQPDIVVVFGTRIIVKRILNCVTAPFINIHAGITPQYRGVHGGYWALADGLPALVGTTIHYVDQGIDTGRVIRHIPFTPTPADNFVTYPYLHIGTALQPLQDIVTQIVTGAPVPEQTLAIPQQSKLQTHPTAWQYLATRLRRRVY